MAGNHINYRGLVRDIENYVCAYTQFSRRKNWGGVSATNETV